MRYMHWSYSDLMELPEGYIPVINKIAGEERREVERAR